LYIEHKVNSLGQMVLRIYKGFAIPAKSALTILLSLQQF
jgi:hypothetical protein